MSIHINNSFSRKKEDFIPLNPPTVNIYTCGVTVYDECHIGHARSLYIFDLIRRYLIYRGFKVNFVRNITDIDDKIINRANELKVDWSKLVEKYITSYYQDLELLDISKADYEPRATENIPDMIEYIKALIDKGYAYPTESGVYFSVRKFKNYGKLSGQSIDEMLSGVRKDSDETKQDPLDFALWKSSKANEPSWDSPWGRGRPGWHIECSVMSQKYLKTDTLDIHAGGRDLIFPHHENEIAQAESFSSSIFAKYWIHHGLLTINGQKMAKSLGNFVTIKDFMEKYKNANFLKLFFLSAHYSHPIDYTTDKIEEARQALERINIFVNKAVYISGKSAKGLPSEVGTLKDRFIEAIDDDFNSPRALAVVFDLVNIANKNIDDMNFVKSALNTLFDFLSVLGISTQSFVNLSSISDEEIQVMISKRKQAKLDKNYSLSDNIRKELEDKGVVLEDLKDGSTLWRRKI